MPLRSHPLVGDAEVMPNLPEGTLPLEAQTHTQGTPTHCCGGVGDVLGGKGHKVGGLGHASLCCAPLQNEAGLGITGQQQDKVPEPIEGVGESIQSGDVRVPEGTSWGPKGMEPFWGEEEEQMLVSFQGGEQPQSCGGSAARTGILQSVANAWGPCTAQCPGTAEAEPGDSPGVGGTYPSQPTLGLFSANLAQNRGFPTRRQHQSNASSSLSVEEGAGMCQGPCSACT